MNKLQENMRNNLVSNNAIEKILDNSSILFNRDLRKKEFAIYNCICELVTSSKISVGYQFGIKRFNSIFTQWENGKSTEKTTVLPTVTEIYNACKYFYSHNALNCGFMPILRFNNDGTIIVDCVSYVENYYTQPTEKKEIKISREKQLEKIGKMILSLNDEINNAIANNVLESDDINDILKSICNIDIVASASKVVTEKKNKKRSA